MTNKELENARDEFVDSVDAMMRAFLEGNQIWFAWEAGKYVASYEMLKFKYTKESLDDFVKEGLVKANKSYGETKTYDEFQKFWLKTIIDHVR